MQIIKHAAIPEVVQVVKPETFDLIGLSATDMAILLITLGSRAYVHEIPCEIYGLVRGALGVDSNGGIDRVVMSPVNPDVMYSYRIPREKVEDILSRRTK